MKLSDFFKKTLPKGIVYSSYLIHGKKHIGKRLFVDEIVKTLQCEINKDGYTAIYCNQCTSCITLTKRIHPDVCIITPLKEMIRIASAREIITFLDFAPLEARYKIVIIDDADTMNIQTQNALLKTIEEPPPNTIMFFIVHTKSAILPTIQSRSCILKALTPLSIESPEEVHEKKDYRLDFMSTDSLVETISLIKDKEGLRNYIGHILFFLKKCITSHDDLKINEGRVFDCIDYTLSCEKRIKENCNVPLTLTNLHLKLRSLYANS